MPEDIEKVCRICREGTDDGILYSPCVCKSYVHQVCLISWDNVKKGLDATAFSDFKMKCEICGANIIFKFDEKENIKPEVLKEYIFQHIWNFRKIFHGVFIIMMLPWLIINFYVCRTYFLYNILPYLSCDYFQEHRVFLKEDCVMFVPHLIVCCYVIYKMIKRPSIHNVIKFHFREPIATDFVPVSFSSLLSFECWFTLFLAIPIVLPIFLMVTMNLPFALTNLIFNSKGYSNPTVHLCGNFLLFSLLSFFPIKLVPKANYRLFKWFLYTIFFAKVYTEVNFWILMPTFVARPIVKFIFGRSQFKINFFPMSLHDVSYVTLWLNPFFTFTHNIGAVMDFLNKKFFREGTLYMFSDNMSHVDILLTKHLWVCWLVKKTFGILIFYALFCGQLSLSIIKYFKPQFFPIELGLELPSDDYYSLFGYNLWNLLLVVTFPLFLMKSVSSLEYILFKFYYPLIQNLAKQFKLSSFLFNVEESENDIKSTDKTYMRAPSSVPIDITALYFVSVTKEDKLLNLQPVKKSNPYMEFRENKSYFYDIVHTPPYFKLRLFSFLLVLGIIHSTNMVFFFLTSNFLGQFFINLIQRVIDVQFLVTFHSNDFSILNMFLGVLAYYFIIFIVKKYGSFTVNINAILLSAFEKLFAVVIVIDYFLNNFLFSRLLTHYFFCLHLLLQENIGYKTSSSNSELLTGTLTFFQRFFMIFFTAFNFWAIYKVGTAPELRIRSDFWSVFRIVYFPIKTFAVKYLVPPVIIQICFNSWEKNMFAFNNQNWFFPVRYYKNFLEPKTWKQTLIVSVCPVYLSIMLGLLIYKKITKLWSRHKQILIKQSNSENFVLQNID